MCGSLAATVYHTIDPVAMVMGIYPMILILIDTPAMLLCRDLYFLGYMQQPVFVLMVGSEPWFIVCMRCSHPCLYRRNCSCTNVRADAVKKSSRTDSLPSQWDL